MPNQPSRTGPLARFVDRCTGRFFGLPPGGRRYSVTRGVRIPMRDGVDVAADLYRPDGPSAGTVLVRTPYGRGMPYALLQGRLFATRGYTTLFVSSRGTFGSGGEFDPMRTEAEDGQDAVAWLRAQPWFTGRLATVGASYLAYTQWALLADPPEELVAAVAVFGPHDYARHTWGTGAFNLDLLPWADLIAHQEEGGLRVVARAATSGRRLRPAIDGLPLADAAGRCLGDRAAWYRDRVVRPDLDDPFWAPMRHATALDRVTAPVLVIGGWDDIFLTQTIEQYAHLRDRGTPVGLTIGPWRHVDLMGRAHGLVLRETFDWLDQHLAGGPQRRPTATRVHVTGVGGGWREAGRWPPTTTPAEWFLGPDNAITAEPPPPDAVPACFTFDPGDPTPSIGGPFLSGGGRVDDSRLAARADVLAWTSPPLDAGLAVTGAPSVVLAHGTDNPHADLFVRLSEVDSSGRSRNVTEGYLRLEPTRGPQPVTIQMRDTAHRFAAGSRLRLLIAGGSHPRYARNLGTGENPGTGTGLRPTTHTITLGPQSRLVLPVAEESPAAA